MKCYFGEVHSHTTESDGKGGSPRDAYVYARDIGKADYFAVTDHNTHLREENYIPLVRSLSDEFSEDGRYAALYGYEMSYDAASGFYGHLNILGSHNIEGTDVKLRDWYDMLRQRREDIIGQFNHPGEKWGDFEEFRYDEDMARVFRLIELRIEEYGVPVIETEYERCLSKGWHVGPVSNEDTHGRDWTTCREETGAVLAESLSREDIADAMRKNRTYATSDRSLKVFYRANGEWIGSTLQKTGRLYIEADMTTEKECGLGIVQAVGEHNTVLAQIDLGNEKSYVWHLCIPDSHRYVYIRRHCGLEYAVTAPVWVEQPDAFDLDVEFGFDTYGVRVEGKLKNISDTALTDIRAYAYVGSSRLVEGIPLDIGICRLSAGETADVSLSLDFDYLMNDVVIEICADMGGLPVRVSKKMHTCPLTVDKIFPSTTRYSAQRYYGHPFFCVDIRNLSPLPVDASAYTFRFYHHVGIAYEDFFIDRIIGGGETVTVWFRSDRLLDEKDFNQYFDTDLVEGRELISVPVSIKSGKELCRKLLICRGNNTARRAWIRYSELQNTHIPVGSAIGYSAMPGSATAKVTGIYDDAVPHVCGDDGSIPAFKDIAKRRTALPGKNRQLGKVVCFADGKEDEKALLDGISRIGDADSVELVWGSNENERTDAYIKREGDRLLRAIAGSDADTVALCLGGRDCGVGQHLWLERNFLSLATLLEGMCLYMSALGKRTVLISPSTGREYTADYARLQRTLATVADTVGCMTDVDKRSLIPVSVKASDIPEDIKPVDGALKIACIGDGYTGGGGGITPYPTNLQCLFGDRADVRIFSAEGAIAAEGSNLNFNICAGEMLSEMERFDPDAVVLWLCMTDLKIKNCREWDTFRERYMSGFLKVVENLARKVKKRTRLYVISAFRRRPDDIRVEVAMRAGDGLAATVRELAERVGAEHIDIMEASVENPELIAVGRNKVNYLSEAGSMYLAQAVYREIAKLMK
ncbi:MAG: CehA/McbA family metallohydrolase [Clostridia bacterium]|nr:CehA/McbA family metallohydrolase [Clostridia bacterium]